MQRSIVSPIPYLDSGLTIGQNAVTIEQLEAHNKKLCELLVNVLENGTDCEVETGIGMMPDKTEAFRKAAYYLGLT